ncbi:MAG TPA: MFS transporter [Actinomycetota bacterium]|nr:MFS transporter [Actinomycetota bacterium]
MPQSAERRLRILSPLAERDFRLLWAGQTVSLLGDGITTIALAWQTYELSRNPVALSMVLLARSVPMLVLLLIGGAVSDRLPRRAVMLASDLVRGAAVGVIAFLSAGGVLEVWHLVVLAAVFGAADAFFQPAYSAVFPDILPKALLVQANSLTSATRPVTLFLAGPALGGLLVGALGSASAFGADAATFAVSAACLLGMRSRPGRGTGGEKILAEIGEGLRYTRGTPWIWATLIAAAVSILFVEGPYHVLLPIVVAERLGGGAAVFGFVSAVEGLGALLGAIAIGQWGVPRRKITVMYIAWSVSCVIIGLIGVAPTVAAAAAFSGLSGAGFQLGAVIWATMLQQLVPARMLGRVTSLDWLVSFALAPVSFGLAGPVARQIGGSVTLLAGGVLGGIALLLGLLVPGVRDPERRDPGVGTDG